MDTKELYEAVFFMETIKENCSMYKSRFVSLNNR